MNRRIFRRMLHHLPKRIDVSCSDVTSHLKRNQYVPKLLTSQVHFDTWTNERKAYFTRKAVLLAHPPALSYMLFLRFQHVVNTSFSIEHSFEVHTIEIKWFIPIWIITSLFHIRFQQILYQSIQFLKMNLILWQYLLTSQCVIVNYSKNRLKSYLWYNSLDISHIGLQPPQGQIFREYHISIYPSCL